MKTPEVPFLLSLVAWLGGCNGNVVFGQFGARSELDAESVGDVSSEGLVRADVRDAQVPDAQAPDASIDADARNDVRNAQEDGDAVCVPPTATVLVSAPNIVIPIYLVASDTEDRVAASRLVYFQRGLAAVQTWYGEVMAVGGMARTFRFDPPRVLKSTYAHSQWDDFGVNGFPRPDAGPEKCGLWNAALDDLSNHGILANAGLPPLGAQGDAYLVIAGGGATGGCISRDMSVIEEMTLRRIEARCPNGVYDACTRGCAEPGGLADIDPWCRESPHDESMYACSAVGGIASDLAYQFGMKRSNERPEGAPAACGRLLDAWWEYRRSEVFCEADKMDLLASGYLGAPF